MSKKINRVGEEGINNFGSKMIIKEYRKYSDIDVYFPEYNWTFEHARYQSFKNGEIKCPYEPKVYGVGYLGEGKYKALECGKKTDKYEIWHQNISKCCRGKLKSSGKLKDGTKLVWVYYQGDYSYAE